MLMPQVTETPITHGAPRHGENAEQYERRPRKPRSQPYDRRTSQRELVRQSLDREMHTHAYDREMH